MDASHPIATRIQPSPVTPDSIAVLCRTAEEMIGLQRALPDLQEAISERFLAHEELTRLHLSAISDNKTAILQTNGLLKELIGAIKGLKGAIEELLSSLDQAGRR